MTRPRQWKNVVLTDDAGNVIGVAGSPLIVNVEAGSTTPFPVTNSEELSHSVADTGIQPLYIGSRASTPAPLPVPEGAVTRVWIDPNGRIHVVDDAVHPGENDALDVLGVITKPLADSTYAPPLLAANFGTATDISVKAAPGNLFSFVGTNDNAAIRYLQVHNLAAAIGAGAVPVLSFPVAPTGGRIQIGKNELTDAGAWFSVGIRFGWSSTKGTYTAGTAGDHTTDWAAV